MKSLALAFLLFSTAAIEVNTGRLADGATQTFLSGSRKVAVHKSGGTATVMVQEGDRLDTITLSRAGGTLDIARSDNGAPRRFLVLDRPKIVVDGIDLEPYLMNAMTVVPESAPMPGPMSQEGALEAVPMPMPNERAPKAVPMPIPPSHKLMPGPTDGPYYVCPKDARIVVAPAPASADPVLCPTDGTPMKAHVGRNSKFFLIE